MYLVIHQRLLCYLGYENDGDSLELSSADTAIDAKVHF